MRIHLDLAQAMMLLASRQRLVCVAVEGRFQNPPLFMAWLGPVPKERSTGASVPRGSITKAGNTRARRMLVEGTWTYRLPARISRELLT